MTAPSTTLVQFLRRQQLYRNHGFLKPYQNYHLIGHNLHIEIEQSQHNTTAAAASIQQRQHHRFSNTAATRQQEQFLKIRICVTTRQREQSLKFRMCHMAKQHNRSAVLQGLVVQFWFLSHLKISFTRFIYYFSHI